MKVKIKIVQTAPILGDVKKNLIRIESEILIAIKEGAELVIFPELAATGYMLRDLTYFVALTKEKFPQKLLKLSEKIDIIISGVEENSMHNFYNVAIYLSQGKIIHTHRKVYLPTYGIFEEARYFTRGTEFRAFDTRFGRIGMAICEDAWHMTSIYSLYQDRADIIVVLVASPTRGVAEKETASIATWEHMMQTYARLVTTYMVLVNRVGYEDGVCFWGGSHIVSPLGNIEVQLPYFKEASALHTIDFANIRNARIHSQMIKNESIDLVVTNLKSIQKDRK